MEVYLPSNNKVSKVSHVHNEHASI